MAGAFRFPNGGGRPRYTSKVWGDNGLFGGKIRYKAMFLDA